MVPCFHPQVKLSFFLSEAQEQNVTYKTATVYQETPTTSLHHYFCENTQY